MIRIVGRAVIVTHSRELRISLLPQLACFLCNRFGKDYGCPPSTPLYPKCERVVHSFETCIIVIEYYDLGELVTKYIEQGWSAVRALGWSQILIDRITYHRFRKLVDNVASRVPGERKLILRGGGGCRLCRVCAKQLGEPCRRPNQRVSAPEAWGIEVYRVIRSLGLPIEVVPRNYQARVGMIFSDAEPEEIKEITEHSLPKDLPRYRVLEDVFSSLERIEHEQVLNSVSMLWSSLAGKTVEVDNSRINCANCPSRERCSSMLLDLSTVSAGLKDAILDVYEVRHGNPKTIARRLAAIYMRSSSYIALPVAETRNPGRDRVLCPEMLGLSSIINGNTVAVLYIKE